MAQLGFGCEVLVTFLPKTIPGKGLSDPGAKHVQGRDGPHQPEVFAHGVVVVVIVFENNYYCSY